MVNEKKYDEKPTSLGPKRYFVGPRLPQKAAEHRRTAQNYEESDHDKHRKHHRVYIGLMRIEVRNIVKLLPCIFNHWDTRVLFVLIKDQIRKKPNSA